MLSCATTQKAMVGPLIRLADYMLCDALVQVVVRGASKIPFWPRISSLPSFHCVHVSFINPDTYFPVQVHTCVFMRTLRFYLQMLWTNLKLCCIIQLLSLPNMLEVEDSCVEITFTHANMTNSQHGLTVVRNILSASDHNLGGMLCNRVLSTLKTAGPVYLISWTELLLRNHFSLDSLGPLVCASALFNFHFQGWISEIDYFTMGSHQIRCSRYYFASMRHVIITSAMPVAVSDKRRANNAPAARQTGS